MIRLAVTSVFVNDQDRALDFYTEILGFVKRRDVPVGEARWLTVVQPGAPGEVELLLEPNTNPIARTYQSALYAEGIPATTFATDDIEGEYERMTRLGVVFLLRPTWQGPVIKATFDDTCGNLIGLFQMREA